MKNKKTLYALIGLVAAAVIFFFVYKQLAPKPAAGTKAYTLEVVDADGEIKAYSGKTDAEYLINLMDEVAEKTDFSYEKEDGEYGAYITTVNGLKADYNTDGAYWAIFVNGEYGQYGADQQPVADGDIFRLAYSK